ncbi:hypothetical protein, conserved [Plasmodium vivax]|uniref:Uncharacterized protein n=4 Tax=Plasmodium vivax TaxID=5855 RepID=A5KAE5_PLAVS|nr:hypothetical protein, conserved [Plasmodium vivax]EDL43781.1 hypothetical protein, conserved [Plasmodium vivax]KMZ89527.1 hypothetical protein PVBG_03248 [Plasmodium vivax Brazil I]KMZ95888.1 hypothetical protein PVMG_03962 [Plasmodium vivax Mauritania I]KNA02502.1 hypothetical protein PVNG_03795 [Plasmodium vivax North Korean]|eukprot:XP_001613508.1 hypothetical protein [Plasmodium vivax Sal-1]
MKTKKTARQSARQIAGRLKQIERECRQLSKHIRRVGEERKSFELTTALLKKYHSYVDSNLMNDLSIFPSSSAFVKSCGIVFSSKTVWEDPDEEDGDDNGDTVGQTDGKEEPHSRSPPDSCINSMGKGKVLSSFINKTESKCNPFYHFVSNVRRLFSLGEKEEEPNERGTTDEGKSERMTPFKFRCLVKAKRIVLYTCVCPQCEKNFYLLMRRSGRGKVAPRVLPPAQFAAVISHLREQRGGIPHMDIPHMDVAHLAPHEAGEHFCSCYVGMDEGGGGLFGDADVLAYL